MTLKRSARAWGLALSDTIEFAFRRRYGLTPRDPRFLDCTVEEILVDYWAHAHVDDPKLRLEEVSSDFEGDLAAAELEDGVTSEGPLGALPDPGDFEAEIEESYCP